MAGEKRIKIGDLKVGQVITVNNRYSMIPSRPYRTSLCAPFARKSDATNPGQAAWIHVEYVLVLEHIVDPDVIRKSCKVNFGLRGSLVNVIGTSRIMTKDGLVVWIYMYEGDNIFVICDSNRP